MLTSALGSLPVSKTVRICPIKRYAHFFQETSSQLWGYSDWVDSCLFFPALLWLSLMMPSKVPWSAYTSLLLTKLSGDKHFSFVFGILMPNSSSACISCSRKCRFSFLYWIRHWKTSEVGTDIDLIHIKMDYLWFLTCKCLASSWNLFFYLSIPVSHPHRWYT